ncbi:hypothetical protein [Hansschlegelia beijingensis]|uniref:Uncharacterized protein n=1 Tax=Hansschlegelia beijingensis TaxID=1133344 RepID=A0A7W6GFD1_9HYPH|nr:hypothetical protein [Hansschlegelia beijingensis]MBB3972812.1 hypothetical protein [Hansschlegelia beijingensis]
MQGANDNAARRSQTSGNVALAVEPDEDARAALRAFVRALALRQAQIDAAVTHDNDNLPA